MKKFIWILLYLFSGVVSAYDVCNPNTPIVPCTSTTNSVDMDTVIGSSTEITFYQAAAYDISLEPYGGRWYNILIRSGFPNYAGEFFNNGPTWNNYGSISGAYAMNNSSFFWQGTGAPHQLTVNLTPQTGGVIESNPTSDFACSNGVCQGNFAGSVTLTATATEHWSFSYWNDGTISSSDNPLLVNMSGDKTLTAVFVSVPEQVLSPTEEQLGVVTSDSYCSGLYQQGKWCFNQHGTGAHIFGGGVGGSDDSKAWDANWNYPTYDNDSGKPVYAIADGTVAISYAGSQNAGGTTGQVLIEHPGVSGGSWWSGYLHLNSIQVTPGTPVTTSTVIGYVSNTGTSNNHLHFVVYSGENAYGKLKSINVPIIAR